MLSNAVVAPTLVATDLKRARKFYEEKLGFTVIVEDPTIGLLLQAGQGSTLYIYERGPSVCDHTVASFTVENFDAEIQELKSRGVMFEEYDIPGMGIKTVNGIATMNGIKGAWFKDSEGNILAIGEWSIAKMKAATGQQVGAGASTRTRASR